MRIIERETGKQAEVKAWYTGQGIDIAKEVIGLETEEIDEDPWEAALVDSLEAEMDLILSYLESWTDYSTEGDQQATGDWLENEKEWYGERMAMYRYL